MIFYFYMAEKKEEIKHYLQEHVNPILKPLLEQLSKERPPNIMQFILNYAQQHLQKHAKNAPVREGTLASEEEGGMTKEQEEAFARKL